MTLLLAGWPSGLAQTSFDSNPDTPTSILAAVIFLGSVIVGGLLVALRTLWQDGKGKDQAITHLQSEYGKQQQEQLRSSLQVTIDSTNQLKESAELMERAMVIIHAVSGRQFPTETYSEILSTLREMRGLREQQLEEMRRRGQG